MKSFFGILLRVLKYALILILIVVAASLIYSGYQDWQDAKAFKKSAFIQELNKKEQNREDTFSVLVSQMRLMDTREARLVIKWLEPRQSRGNMPYLYLLGAYNVKIGRANEGVKYYAAGALVYRVDMVKCADRTAYQAVPIIENSLGAAGLEILFIRNPLLRQAAADWALAYEQKSQDRPRPDWICAHGLKAFGTEGDTPLTYEEFVSRRKELRSQFIQLWQMDKSSLQKPKI